MKTSPTEGPVWLTSWGTWPPPGSHEPAFCRGFTAQTMALDLIELTRIIERSPTRKPAPINAPPGRSGFSRSSEPPYVLSEWPTETHPRWLQERPNTHRAPGNGATRFQLMRTIEVSACIVISFFPDNADLRGSSAFLESDCGVDNPYEFAKVTSTNGFKDRLGDAAGRTEVMKDHSPSRLDQG